MVDQALRLRCERHERIAAQLDHASDGDLLRLLSDAQVTARGHATLSLPDGEFVNRKVFAKLVPLTPLELRPENRHSTANLFALPTYYQYRLGSCGFGTWRELAVHDLANEWVTSGQCPRFPLLHHWRALPIVASTYDDRTSVKQWGDNPAIHERAAGVLQATSSAVLFLEHFPFTLREWLRDQLAQHPDPLEVVTGVEDSLTEVLAFMHAQGVLHMDAHFENVLTDGDELYLSDHGLALSRGFQLAADEQQFFDEHQTFDLCTVINDIVYTLVTQYDPRDDWRQTLREMTDGAGGGDATVGSVPPAVRAYLTRNAPLVLAMGDYYRRFLADLTTPYPGASLQRLLDDARADE